MTTIQVKGMKCQHCAGSVKKALDAIDGVSNVNVELETGVVSFDGPADMEFVQSAVKKAGFTVVVSV
jgi:copper chaperone